MVIVGKVQDIGFRALTEYASRLLDLSGLVFNAKDGSLRIICRGEDRDILAFSKEIKIRGKQRGAIIQDITKQEIPFDIDLPYPFSRVLSDEDTDIGRKLDKGNELLGNLPEIKDMLGSFVTKQDEHNQRLEKILEKLAES